MSLGEFDFIRRHLHTAPAEGVLLGIGDDAALLRPRAGVDYCVSTDMLLAGRHFFGDEPPADIAHKVLAVNLSDMAAMGAQPRYLLLSAALPQLDEAWLTSFCRQLQAMAAEYGATLVGGDTTRGDYVFNITIIGELPAGQALRRSSAQAGDEIWVSGQLGLAAAGLQQRLGRLMLPENVAARCVQALQRPQPRLALGRALLPLAHAALDVSDGLAQDLGHILQASAVGADLDLPSLPTLPALRRLLPEQTLYPLLLAGGDDYELLFTAAAENRPAILAAASASETPVCCIGRIRAESGLCCRQADGSVWPLERRGYDHFD